MLISGKANQPYDDFLMEIIMVKGGFDHAAFNAIRKVVPIFSSEDLTKIFPAW